MLGVAHASEQARDWKDRRALVASLVTRRHPLAAINPAYEDLETDAILGQSAFRKATRSSRSWSVKLKPTNVS